MITADDESLFTRGGCLVLAELLNEQTGWPIYSLNTSEYPDEPDLHAFVRTPDGQYLDIEGKHTRDEMLARWAPWQPFQLAEYDPEDFDETWTQRGEPWAKEYEQRGAELVPELIAMA